MSSKKSAKSQNEAAVKLVDSYLKSKGSSYEQWQNTWDEKSKQLDKERSKEFDEMLKAAVLPHADEFLLLMQDNSKL